MWTISVMVLMYNSHDIVVKRANICKVCRAARKVWRCSTPHMSKATDINWCEIIAHDILRGTVWRQMSILGSRGIFWDFFPNAFWKHCSFISISNFGVRRPLLFIPLLEQSPEFDLCLQNDSPRRIAWVCEAHIVSTTFKRDLPIWRT